MGCWRNKIEDSFPHTSPCDTCLFYKSVIQNKESTDAKNKIKVLTYICDKKQNMYRVYKDQTCAYYSKFNMQELVYIKTDNIV